MPFTWNTSSNCSYEVHDQSTPGCVRCTGTGNTTASRLYREEWRWLERLVQQMPCCYIFTYCEIYTDSIINHMVKSIIIKNISLKLVSTNECLSEFSRNIRTRTNHLKMDVTPLISTWAKGDQNWHPPKLIYSVRSKLQWYYHSLGTNIWQFHCPVYRALLQSWH